MKTEKTVTLANQTRTMLVLNLPFDIVPEMSSRGMVGTRDHDRESGARTVRAHRKRISGSITLLPKGHDGDIVRGLPASVLNAPDVQRALNAWPPKLASKVLDDDAKATDDALREAGLSARKAEADRDREMAAARAAKVAKMAGAEIETTKSGVSDESRARLDDASKPAGRVARPAAKE